MNSEVIGINGRGSFKKRGRVNVGLGYAISVNQIKYFIPELLSTKLVEHGTLDASFGERGGKIVCERLSLDAPIAKAGLIPGSELIAFEGIPMTTVDQFTNLISTLPEDWPAEVTFLDEDNQQQTAHVRLFGLPYAPKKAAAPKQPKIPTPDQRKKMQRAQAMMKVLTHPAGQIRDKELNRLNCQRILDDWKTLTVTDASIPGGIKIEDQIVKNGEQIGKQTILISRGGKFRVEHEVNAVKTAFVFDGETFEKKTADDEIAKLSHLQARLTPEIVQATTLCNVFHEKPFAIFGDVLLDGADKAQKKIAYRVKTLDKGGDWFFVWLSLENDKGEREVRLLKASADKNADGESGAVSFLDWREFGGMQIPYRRDFVNGLEEKIGFQAFTINVSPVSELTDDLFKLSVEEE